MQDYYRKLQAQIATLTPRQRDVFNLMLEGLTTQQIAEKLGTAPTTVKTQRQAVWNTLGIHTSHPGLVNALILKLNRAIGRLEGMELCQRTHAKE